MFNHEPSSFVYRPFSALNLSQLSFNVANTNPAISLTSVDASCGNYHTY